MAKHFPGHGDTAVDSHYGLPVVDKSLEELEELELRPFRQAIDTTCVYGTYGGDTSIPAIMVAHHPPGVRSTRTTRPPCLPRW